jgi:hypothetical protein
MSVFLRWGVFGILAVAALVYAYNASKRMAESRNASAPAAAAPESDDEGASEEPEVASREAVPDPAPEHCEAELRVAERALQARREQEPLDRLMRVRLIVFESDPARRQRLEKVAADWYLLEGEEPVSEALRVEVISSCLSFSPAP